MTRERLIEIMNCHSDADTERLADAILAEMAGEWNAAIDQCIAKTRGVLDKNPDGIVWRTKTIGEVVLAIRALRRPDAAPARPATPSVEEVARAMRTLSADDRATVMSNFCKHCGRDDPRCQCWNDE